MSYLNYSNNPRSEKIITAWVEPKQRLVIWTLYSGAVYSRDVDQFTVGVKKDTMELTEGTSTSLNAGEFYYTNGTIYIRLSDDSDPNNAFITAIYRLFYSNKPLILPYDMSTGSEVEYEGVLDTVSSFGQQLDNSDQLGIALESQGSLSFLNNSGVFQSIFDALIWENARVVVYSWNQNLQYSEKRKLFEGQVKDKTYGVQKVSLQVKDFIYKLRKQLPLSLFSDSDGNLSDSIIGKPKRRVYGTVDGLKLQSIDQIDSGRAGTGTLSVTAGSLSLTGVGTSFLSELSPGDQIQIETTELSIETIASDTALTLSDESSKTFAGENFSIIPADPSNKYNRVFHVSNDKLFEKATTVSNPVSFNKLDLADANDLFAGDAITVNGEDNIIKSVNGSRVILNQNLDALPSIGAAITRSPIKNVYFNHKEIVVSDYTVSNITECKITLDSDAEFNTTPEKNLVGDISFLNSSRDVTIASGTFQGNIEPRDYIKSSDINHTTWYEVLEVTDETNLILRVAYAGADRANDASCKVKNVKYIEDNSTVICNCYGLENSSGEWVKTASDIVKHLVSESGLTNIDTASFATSKIEAPYIMSLTVPEAPLANSPTYRDIINLVNKSVFGSLVNLSTFNIAFNILSAEKPSTVTAIDDSDKLTFNVKTRTQIYDKVTVNYRHSDATRYKAESSFKIYEYDTTFVQNIIGNSDAKTFDIYLYSDIDAETIAERIALIYSLTQSEVTIKGKLNLVNFSLNDKISIDFERMYTRFGDTSNSLKIGIVSKVVTNGADAELRFNDLGNIFNKCGAVTPNDANTFSTALNTEKIKNGFVVDNSTETPDITSDKEIGINLIA